MNSHWRSPSNNLMKLDWPSRTILDDPGRYWTIPDSLYYPGWSRAIPDDFCCVWKKKKTLKKKIQNVSFTKSKMLVLPNPKCQFYQIQNVSFTKSIMSVLPIQNVSFIKSKMSVLPNPNCQFYQIQNVSFTKSIMSVLPIQNVSFTKSKMSVLNKQNRKEKRH